MSMPNFEGIFYPSEPSEFNSLLPLKEDCSPNGALVLMPHSSLSVAASLMSESLSRLKPSKNILLLVPCHSQKAKSGLFGTTQSVMEGINGKVRLGTFQGLEKEDASFDREYAPELAINAISRYYPEATIYPVICNPESRMEYAALRSLIALKLADGFSICLSGNLTCHSKGERMRREAETLVHAVENKEPLLAFIREKKVSGCASPLLEAVSSLPLKLQFGLFQCGADISETIDTNKGDGDIWYGSAWTK